MAWYEYRQDARQVPSMYELSGQSAKDGRKAFWLFVGLFGSVVAVVGGIFDAIFGISVGIVVIGGIVLAILGIVVNSGSSKPAPPRGRWHQREIIRRTRLGY